MTHRAALSRPPRDTGTPSRLSPLYTSHPRARIGPRPVRTVPTGSRTRPCSGSPTAESLTEPLLSPSPPQWRTDPVTETESQIPSHQQDDHLISKPSLCKQRIPTSVAPAHPPIVYGRNEGATEPAGGSVAKNQPHTLVGPVSYTPDGNNAFHYNLPPLALSNDGKYLFPFTSRS